MIPRRWKVVAVLTNTAAGREINEDILVMAECVTRIGARAVAQSFTRLDARRETPMRFRYEVRRRTEPHR